MLKPNQDRLIIKRVELEAKTAGGIILSSVEVKDNRDLAWGKVIHAGLGKRTDKGDLIPMEAKVGDIVGYNERQPLRFHYKYEYLYLLRDSDVLVINDDTDLSVKPFTEVDESQFKQGPKYIG